jgi:hypothetical protein
MATDNDTPGDRSTPPGDPDRNEQRRQFVVAVMILAGVLLLAVGMMLGWRWLPGFLGDYFRGIAGIVTTPFLLEAVFIILGLVIVIALNQWRAQREGDEFVYLEETGPDTAADQPLAARAQAALAGGKAAVAADLLARMDEEEARRPESLRVRLELARATGDEPLADQLEREIHNNDKAGGCH